MKQYEDQKKKLTKRWQNMTKQTQRNPKSKQKKVIPPNNYPNQTITEEYQQYVTVEKHH